LKKETLMFEAFASLAAVDLQYGLVISGIIVGALFALLLVAALVNYGAL
jgi:hypothetical protein